jgi:hypothetical protein
VRPAVVHDPALAPQFSFEGSHNRSAAAGLIAELGSKVKAAMLSSQTRLAGDFADLLLLPLSSSTALPIHLPTLYDVRPLPESDLSPVLVS